MKPLIGITTFIDHQGKSEYVAINENYTWSVTAAGGLPCTLPVPDDRRGEERGLARELARDTVARLDGLLLSGGGDLSPLLYGEAVSRHIATMSSARDDWELALFAAALERGLPVLGICRGHQVINVAMGGTLYQDLPSQLPEAMGHRSDMPMDEPCHWVGLEPGSLAARAFGRDRVLTNSFHHQAVKALAPGLVAAGRAGDGVNEAFESADASRFILGLQFHPEALTRRYPEFLGPFAAFVRAASRAA